MAADYETQEQVKAAQIEQAEVRKRRIGNARYARLMEDREAAPYHRRMAA